MKSWLTIAFFILTSLFTTSSLASQATPTPLGEANQAAFNAVQQQLSAISLLSGDFKQTQYIQLLSSPLVSHGHFSLSQTKGLIWQQTTPFTSVLTMTQDKMTQRLGNNAETVITKASQPIVFSFANIFLSLFQGNIGNLEQYFTIYFAGTKDAWHIILVPKDSPLNKAIVNIDLIGGTYIQKVMIKQTNHNQTTIEFTNLTNQYTDDKSFK